MALICPYISNVVKGNTMFQLQLRFFNQGEWENTVYKPMAYDKAKAILEHYNRQWQGTHSYRLVEVK